VTNLQVLDVLGKMDKWGGLRKRKKLYAESPRQDFSTANQLEKIGSFPLIKD